MFGAMQSVFFWSLEIFVFFGVWGHGDDFVFLCLGPFSPRSGSGIIAVDSLQLASRRAPSHEGLGQTCKPPYGGPPNDRL